MPRIDETPPTKVQGSHGCIDQFDGERKRYRTDREIAIRDGLLELKESMLIQIDALALALEEADIMRRSLDRFGPLPSAGEIDRLKELSIDGVKLLVAPALRDLYALVDRRAV